MVLVSLGVLLAFSIVGALVYLYVQDVTQEKHAVLLNFPLVGQLRYIFERLGEYFRQYFFLGDREGMPFDRATRSWCTAWPRTRAALSASARPTAFMKPVR